MNNESVSRKLREVIERWGWDDTFFTFLYAVALTGAVLGVTAICRSHEVRGYYVEAAANNAVQVTCVMQRVDWDSDARAFCSADVDKALSVYRALREGK